MTTEEIKDLIASAIAGQGNQVDSGGKLAEILNALVTMAAGVEIRAEVDVEAERLVITEEQKQLLLNLAFNGEGLSVYVSHPTAEGRAYYKTVTFDYGIDGDIRFANYIFKGTEESQNFSIEISEPIS